MKERGSQEEKERSHKDSKRKPKEREAKNKPKVDDKRQHKEKKQPKKAEKADAVTGEQRKRKPEQVTREPVQDYEYKAEASRSSNLIQIQMTQDSDRQSPDSTEKRVVSSVNDLQKRTILVSTHTKREEQPSSTTTPVKDEALATPQKDGARTPSDRTPVKDERPAEEGTPTRDEPPERLDTHQPDRTKRLSQQESVEDDRHSDSVSIGLEPPETPQPEQQAAGGPEMQTDERKKLKLEEYRRKKAEMEAVKEKESKDVRKPVGAPESEKMEAEETALKVEEEASHVENDHDEGKRTHGRKHRRRDREMPPLDAPLEKKSRLASVEAPEKQPKERRKHSFEERKKVQSKEKLKKEKLKLLQKESETSEVSDSQAESERRPRKKPMNSKWLPSVVDYDDTGPVSSSSAKRSKLRGEKLQGGDVLNVAAPALSKWERDEPDSESEEEMPVRKEEKKSLPK